jgi:hypothetical protein
MPALMGWLIWIPLIVLGVLLVLFAITALLARIRGGRYLRPIVELLSKIPFMRKMFMRMSNAALERQNPELASAVRKIQAFGTPNTPEAAQRALSRLTPAERKAYMEAAGEQAELPDAPNRAARRKMSSVQPPAGSSRPGASGRKKRKR